MALVNSGTAQSGQRNSDGRVRGGLRGRIRRWISLFAVLSVLASGSIVGSTSAAFAVSYPSYADVQNARRSESAKNAEIGTLNQLLATLQSAVDSTQADAMQKGAAAQAAQQKYDEAAAKAVKLKGQADDAQARANRSKQEAGKLAARLVRSGGSDLSSTLFFNSSESKSLLSELGLATMVKDQSAGIYERAIQNQNVARALTDQADVAKEALKALAGEADKAAKAAADAAVAASVALTEQQAHRVQLTLQLAILVTNTNQTEADFTTGVEVARQAAVAALAAQLAAGPRAGQISSAGWARPAGGHISSPYGYRIDPYNGTYALHSGTDLAAGCGTPIYAAHSGTVVLAGPYGGLWQLHPHSKRWGSSYETAYGHIVTGGLLVGIGQSVQVGQSIARVGSTGTSTGCHLRFEIHHNGGTQDPVPFLRLMGVQLTN